MLLEQINPFVRFARYMNIATKSHPAYISYDARLFYTMDSQAKIKVQGTFYLMKTGSLLLIPPGKEYVYLPAGQIPVRYLILNFDYTQNHIHRKIPVPPDIPEQFQKERILDTITFTDIPQLNEPLFLPQCAEAEPLLMDIEKEYRRQLMYHNMVTGSALRQVLALVVRKLLSPPDTGTNEIIRFIQNNTARNFSNRELGELFHFHPNYINSIIKASTGMSLHRYVLNAKISKAIRLLDTTQMPVREIAQKVGFTDISHFSKVFKKTAGASPNKYRTQ